MIDRTEIPDQPHALRQRWGKACGVCQPPPSRRDLPFQLEMVQGGGAGSPAALSPRVCEVQGVALSGQCSLAEPCIFSSEGGEGAEAPLKAV